MMLRRLVFAAALVACGSSDSKSAPASLDAGVEAGSSSSGGEEEQGVPEEEALPECIVTSIGIWDDFEAPLSEGTQFTTPAIGFDPLHHCGAQGIKATVDTTGQKSLFVRGVPAPATPTKAVSWSFLVSFDLASTAVTFRFAELLMANNHRLIVEFNQGNVLLLEKDDGDAGAEIGHPSFGAATLREWIRLDLRIDYATRKATYKFGPPAGSAPTAELTLVNALDRVTAEQLGPTPPSAGSVTVHYDRAALYVE